MGEYSHTWTSLQPAGHIDVDSGRGGLYATWFSRGLYLNAAIYGGYSNYDTSRSSFEGLASDNTVLLFVEFTPFLQNLMRTILLARV
jgi:hypothetical protein